jgi:trehalose/maltose hydrolase-like predicted phosphorylase
METLFALANGYLGIRGTFEEGTPVYRRASDVPVGSWVSLKINAR